MSVAAGPPIGSLYVHIPFCLSVCPYCDFVVYGGRAATAGGGLLDPFQRAILTELDLRVSALPGRSLAVGGLETVYLGGGTPSLLGARRIGELLVGIDRRLGIASEAEITIEVNPGPRDRGDLRGFVAAGVTRLSIGAQSLDLTELRRLGRRHGPHDVAETVRLARSAAAPSVSLDLLYDVPGQTMASWGATLDGALALEPDHVSAYSLTLDDPETEGFTGVTGDHLPVRVGARRWRTRARADQNAELAAAMYVLADERLSRAGLHWYELSNWARSGHRSRHNLAYWERRPYLALGPGAHGFDGRRRWWNAARLDGYLRALLGDGATGATLPPGDGEIVEGRTADAERVILGLRLSSGLPRAVTAELGRDVVIADAFAWGKAVGLLGGGVDSGDDQEAGTSLALTMRGRLLADELFVRLI